VANMLDGDPATRWSSGQTQAPGQWVQIDLKSATTFDTLFVSAGNTGDYLRGYQVFLSLDGTTWGDPVASGSGEASLVLNLGTQKARYIKIVNTATSDRWWSITDVKVANFGKPAKPAQPALPAPTGQIDRSGWTVQASSRFARDPEQNMLDGARDTVWSSATAQVPGEWIWIDMGASRYVDTVVIDAAGRTGDYPRGIDVFVANESAAWGDPVYSATNLASQRVAATFAPVSGRYIGIRQTGNATNWWSVAELTAAYNGTGALTEIAPAGWTASASSTSGADSASHAIDGQAATRWTSGKPQAAGQWFQIDLGSVQTVKQIDLDANAGASAGDYPRAWQVVLSQDGQTWSDPVASGTGKEAYLSIPLGTHDARYIRVVQTGSASAWWSVAEARVFK
jgi:endo-1,3(4)-beta-glucanase